jgi:EAL domain-containing protein (putative c-di-GMP-specific phosphodiesterase class I)
VIAAEALLRWHHPELGNVSPEVFIPIAEDNSQIRAIGDWVVETACKQLAEWNAQGFVLETLAINVSLIQLHDNKFIQRVKATIEKYNIPCHQVMLEFTESKLAQEISTLQNQLSQIRDTGIGISIDDFGTGYSNMGQLKHLKVDQIKIDRSFIQDAIENPEDQAIINAIIQMAHALKINTLAEGIETDQQWQLMQDLQVDQMQGFHFYRPLTVDDMNHLLLNRLPPI